MSIIRKRQSNALKRTAEKMSQIPTTVSEISRKISNFRLRYCQLVDNAAIFFSEYQSNYRTLALLKRKIESFQGQVDRIDAFKKEKGKYPTIKGQPSARRYIARLVAKQTKLEDEYDELEKLINKARNERYQSLDHLTDEILDLLDGHQIFGQFLGTITLSTPSPEDKIRRIRNEKYKPIYIAALTIALFEEVRLNHDFDCEFLQKELDMLFANSKNMSLMASKSNESNSINMTRAVMPKEIKLAYRENILKPLAKAALLQSIGINSPEAQTIFGEDKYRRLSNKERDSLLAIIFKKTTDFMKLGVGVPNIRFDNRKEKENFETKEQEQLTFMLDLLTRLQNRSDELGDLIRIPMTYASFLLSTKKNFDFREIYRAYDVIEQNKDNYSSHVTCFLKMVGRFPLGAGIYFVQQETGEIERGIVSSLYPSNAEEPICKQITRRQIQFLSQVEVVISKQSNLFFPASRETSHYESDYLYTRYNNDFMWNPVDMWESQISSLEFWKKDGTRKINGRFNPESYQRYLNPILIEP